MSANRALVLFKPSIHAPLETKTDWMRDTLADLGIQVLQDGVKGAEEMELIVDKFYGKLAQNALSFEKEQVSPEGRAKLQEHFKVKWENVYINPASWGWGYNTAKWRGWEKMGKTLKLEDGLYVGEICYGHFITNVFYSDMRKQFVDDSTKKTHWFVVEFECTYSEFKENIIGATDPLDAEPISLRGQLLEKWKELGLERPPSIGENCIHGSANAEEAEKEIALFTS